jgi:glycogen debranching enzyme
LYLSRNRTVLATNTQGFIEARAPLGLFVHETRLLSHYRLLINGRSPKPSALSNVEQHSWLGYYIMAVPNASSVADSGSGHLQDESQHSLEIRISRVIHEGLHEDIDITNFSQCNTSFQLELQLAADFADLAEIIGERQQFGATERRWRETTEGTELELMYRARHSYFHQDEAGSADLERAIRIHLRHGRSPAERTDSTARFSISLAPHEHWHMCVMFTPIIDGRELTPPVACRALTVPAANTSASPVTQFSGPSSGTLTNVVIGALEQGRYDLEALRLHDVDHGAQAWTMAAGLPMYVALFGRDTLTAGWQAALLGPEMMRGALLELKRWQGTQINNWRDEQPGRMLHEAHSGPLEVLNFNPRARSYGSVTTAALYPFVLAELWHWTGDRELIRSLLPAARAGLSWLDQWSRHSPHGFFDYQTRSTDGVENQAWKDSGDAIVDEYGRQVPAPIATGEEQGFAYVSKQFLAEVLWWLDERDEAKRLAKESQELKARFNEHFWMDDENFIALALDHEGRQIRSITSNPGHCVATGILDDALLQKAADRLLRDDLFTGWGIRTLSSQHPAYNPYSYHRGSVWPVEQGTFVLGFRRYGLRTHAERLSRAIFDAAALFDCYRLPELIAGHPRDSDHPFPGMYLQANSPQAWSSSAIFLIIQALLGVYPYAPLNVLLVDPDLPEWLPELTVRDLRVGQSVLSIRFFRKEDGTSSYEVLDIRGTLHVIHQPSPWSLTASFGERLRDLVSTVVH